jgi:ABC-2 type transport system permease protein
MSLLEPGSLAWLVAQEVRLTFRNSKRSARALWLRLFLLLLFLACGIQLAIVLRGVPIEPRPEFLVWGSAILLVLLSFMTTQALIGAQRTLYERTDLDLLFSSPLPEGRVLAAKLLGIAASAAATYLILSLPLAIPIALVGHPRLLALVPVLAALALIAASFGLVLSVMLVRTIGAKRAKTVGQIAAAALGGLIYLVSQLSSQNRPGQGRLVNLAHWMQTHGWGVRGWSAWPARALFGELWPLLGTALIGLVLFSLTSIAFRTHFLASYQKAGDRSARRARKGEAVRTRFAGSLLSAVVLKELRLLAREPGMIFMMLLRLIYLMPVLLAGLGRGGGGVATLATLAGVGVIAAGQLCGSLAWVTISAEDAPDLLAVAPVEGRKLKRLKLLAALLMGLPVAAIVPALLAARSPAAAAIVLLGSLAAGYAAGLVEMLFGKPGKRAAFANRRQGSFLTALAGILVSIAIAGLTALAVVLVIR